MGKLLAVLPLAWAVSLGSPRSLVLIKSLLAGRPVSCQNATKIKLINHKYDLQVKTLSDLESVSLPRSRFLD